MVLHSCVSYESKRIVAEKLRTLNDSTSVARRCRQHKSWNSSVTGMDPVDNLHASSGDIRFSAFTASDKIGWREAGFQKVATLPPRPGDDQANFPSYGVAWSALVELYRQRAAG
jgi:hypothetical protein